MQLTEPPAGGVATVVMVKACVSVLVNRALGASPLIPVCTTSGGVPTQIKPFGAAGRLIWWYVQSFGKPVKAVLVALPNALTGVGPFPAVSVMVEAGVAKLARLQAMLYVKSPVTTG